MQSFTDTTGRAWCVSVTVATVRRVKQLLNIDLLQVALDEGKLLTRLADDPVFLVDVLYAVCKDQADAAAITDEDFGRAMAGDVIGAATQALLESLADFFPRPQFGQRHLPTVHFFNLKTPFP